MTNQLSLKGQFEEKALATLSSKELSFLETKYEVKIRDIVNSTQMFTEKAEWDEDEEEYERELNSTEYSQYKIGQMLEHGYSLVGIPYDNYPPEDIAFVLAHNVIANYGHFSIQDIVRAFNASCTGTTHVSFHPFKQPVGWLYINTILNLYSVHKHQKIGKIEQKLLKVDVRSLLQKKNDIITGRKKDDSAIKHSWINLFNWTISEVPYPLYYIQESHYFYLKDLCLIEESESIKEELLPIAKARVKSERSLSGIKSLSTEIKKEIGTSDIERTYKKICVERWLIKIRVEKVDIESFKNMLKGICFITDKSTKSLLQNNNEIKQSNEG